jgi:hypothetical protein
LKTGAFSDHLLSMLALLVAIVVSSPASPTNKRCPSEFEARVLKIERPAVASVFRPEKTDMPNTTVRLVCRVGGTGALTACAVKRESPPGWGFGEWARVEASRWRVLTRQVRGCRVAGQSVGFKIRSDSR